MATPRSAPTLTWLALVLAALIVGAACGSPGRGTSHSPTPVAGSSPTAGALSPSSSSSPTPTAAPSPTASPLSGAYGVLANFQTAGSYTVSLVATDGKVAASASASAPPMVTCANVEAGLVPAPISTSDSRVYFLDSSGVVRFLTPGGANGQATTVPVSTSSRRSVFAVSPDDSRIAVAVIDFSSGGATTRLYVDALTAGGGHTLIFSQSGSYVLWPMGWHAGDLVLGKVPSCTQGGGPTCCGPQELHVVDPASAARIATLGGPSCIPVGAPTPAGDVCETTAFTATNVLNWNGTTRRAFAISGPTLEYIAPDTNGGIEGLTQVASFDGSDTKIVDGGQTLAGFTVCGWIDESHILAAGDAQQQARIGDVATGAQTPVAALGNCAGRIPGGL